MTPIKRFAEEFMYLINPSIRPSIHPFIHPSIMFIPSFLYKRKFFKLQCQTMSFRQHVVSCNPTQRSVMGNECSSCTYVNMGACSHVIIYV